MYVRGNVPALEGVNVFPLTPVPEYVPPAGLPFESVNAPLFVHRGVTELNVVFGSAFTTTVVFADVAHPLGLVNV